MAGARRRPATKALIILALVIFAGLALVSGFDRQSKLDPRLAGWVPDLFADEALRVRGAALLAQGKAVDARQVGALAIANSPLDPQSSAILGAGRLASGDRVGAERAFRIAGQLGWRVPLTQTYWMGQALTAGDYQVAALRLDALLRQQPGLLGQQQLLDPLERNPAGRAAMIERLALNPPWLRNYTHDVATVPALPMLQRAELLTELTQRLGPLGCTMIQPSSDRLAELGLIAEGRSLWRAHCLKAGTGLLGDSGLDMIDLNNGAGAFGWSVYGDSELQITVSPREPSRGNKISVDGNAGFTRLFLSQLLVLVPGNYALSWQAVDSVGQPSSRALASLGCSGDPPHWQAAVLDPASKRWSVAVNAVPGCRGYVLAFGARNKPGAFSIDQVKLEPAGAKMPVQPGP